MPCANDAIFFRLYFFLTSHKKKKIERDFLSPHKRMSGELDQCCGKTGIWVTTDGPAKLWNVANGRWRMRNIPNKNRFCIHFYYYMSFTSLRHGAILFDYCAVWNGSNCKSHGNDSSKHVIAHYIGSTGENTTEKKVAQRIQIALVVFSLQTSNKNQWILIDEKKYQNGKWSSGCNPFSLKQSQPFFTLFVWYISEQRRPIRCLRLPTFAR